MDPIKKRKSQCLLHGKRYKKEEMEVQVRSLRDLYILLPSLKVQSFGRSRTDYLRYTGTVLSMKVPEVIY